MRSCLLPPALIAPVPAHLACLALPVVAGRLGAADPRSTAKLDHISIAHIMTARYILFPGVSGFSTFKLPFSTALYIKKSIATDDAGFLMPIARRASRCFAHISIARSSNILAALAVHLRTHPPPPIEFIGICPMRARMESIAYILCPMLCNRLPYSVQTNLCNRSRKYSTIFSINSLYGATIFSARTYHPFGCLLSILYKIAIPPHIIFSRPVKPLSGQDRFS